jgi:NAD(P)-dependent dehydrogenase (short-subunit alcohol dehydrogenase family)
VVSLPEKSSYSRAEEEASVAIVDRNLESAERTAEQADEECLALEADVSDGGMVEAVLKHVVRHFGRMDGIHNNAGMATLTLSQRTSAMTVLSVVGRRYRRRHL